MSARPKWTDLLPDRHLLLTTLRGSRVHGKDALLTLICRELEEAQRRAERGPQNARRYSGKVEQGTRRAIGQMPANDVPVRPVDVQTFIEDCGPGFFALRVIPDLRTIAKVLRKVQAEQSKTALHCEQAREQRV